jgi:hypothetical protein
MDGTVWGKASPLQPRLFKITPAGEVVNVGSPATAGTDLATAPDVVTFSKATLDLLARRLAHGRRTRLELHSSRSSTTAVTPCRPPVAPSQ